MSEVQQIVKDEYTWFRLADVRTGKPAFNKFFESKEMEDGTQLGAMFETRVAVDNGDNNPAWYRVRFYDELAEQAKSMLIDENRVARISCQGYMKTSHWKDENENDRYSHYIVVPNKVDDQNGFYQNLTVHSTWIHMGGADASNPFGAPQQNAAERAQAEASNSTAPHPQPTLPGEMADDDEIAEFGMGPAFPSEMTGIDDAPF